MRKLAIVWVALGFVAGLLAATASAVTTEEVLAKISKLRGDMKTLEFDMKTTMKGEQGVLTGHMAEQAVEKDGKRLPPLMNFKQSVVGGDTTNEMLMVHDGEFVWVETRSKGKVTVMKGKSNPSAGKNSPSQFTDNFDLNYVGEEDFDGQKMWVLEGTPKAGTKAAAAIGKIRAWFGQKDGFPRRMIGYSKDSAEISDTHFTNVKLNPTLHPALFKYTPPDGVQVTDLAPVMPKTPMPPQ